VREDFPDGSKNANLSYNHAGLDVWTDRKQGSATSRWCRAASMSADIASRRLSRLTRAGSGTAIEDVAAPHAPVPMKASTDSVAISLFNLMFSRSSLRVVESSSSSRAISLGLSVPTSRRECVATSRGTLRALLRLPAQRIASLSTMHSGKRTIQRPESLNPESIRRTSRYRASERRARSPLRRQHPNNASLAASSSRRVDGDAAGNNQAATIECRRVPVPPLSSPLAASAHRAGEMRRNVEAPKFTRSFR
jgi:hypothetical protein